MKNPKVSLVPSAVFDTDEKYYAFFDNLLKQTYYLSISPSASLYIGANEMMKKKVLHDFLMETRRRLKDRS